MTAPTDGGPAFPKDNATSGYNGMSLRDFFAAKAMPALLNTNVAVVQSGGRHRTMTELATMAYEAADALLAERAKARA